MLIPRRPLRRRCHSSRSTRCDVCRRFRAPFAEIEAYKQRMGWKFKWVSSFGSDFNHDFHVSFTPEKKKRGKVEYNYTMTEFPSEEARASARSLKTTPVKCCTHIHPIPRSRYSRRRLQFPRFCAGGPRRRRLAMEHGLGAPALNTRNDRARSGQLACRHRLLAAIVVEAALGFATEPACFNVLHQKGARSVFRIGESLVKHLHDRQAGIETDEIGELQRPIG